MEGVVTHSCSSDEPSPLWIVITCKSKPARSPTSGWVDQRLNPAPPPWTIPTPSQPLGSSENSHTHHLPPPRIHLLLWRNAPPTHLPTLEVTSPVRRHPRIQGNFRNSSVSLSTQACSLRAGRWRGFPSHEVRPTSSRHTGVGGIRRSWDSACDGPPSQGGAIPSELLGAESRTLLHFPKFFLGVPTSSPLSHLLKENIPSLPSPPSPLLHLFYPKKSLWMFRWMIQGLDR